MSDLQIKSADETWGYPFADRGLMGSEETMKFLGGISYDTLQRYVEAGHIRKGKMPSGKKVGYCRRSVEEFAQGLEV
ncbi:MAG: hypothetical protein HUJ26_13075 [Planctomycetaceae bacterium]|nr:hypothetical protein [Planctomycetaceae bacterium]